MDYLITNGVYRSLFDWNILEIMYNNRQLICCQIKTTFLSFSDAPIKGFYDYPSPITTTPRYSNYPFTEYRYNLIVHFHKSFNMYRHFHFKCVVKQCTWLCTEILNVPLWLSYVHDFEQKLLERFPLIKRSFCKKSFQMKYMYLPVPVYKFRELIIWSRYSHPLQAKRMRILSISMKNNFLTSSKYKS